MALQQQHACDAAIAVLSEWFTSCCSLMPLDSTSLAHSLVTVKYISVDTFYCALQNNPDMLSLELKQPSVYISQISTAVTSYKKNMFLKSLTTEQVCLLLQHHGMSSIKRIVIDNEISGKEDSCWFAARYHLY
jgi:hypothetical protein